MKNTFFVIFLLTCVNAFSQQLPELVKDLNPGVGNGMANSFCEFRGKLFFSARGPANTGSLWMSDGTDSGTVRIADRDGNHVNCSYLTVYNNKIYFSGSNNATGTELWVSDGTSAGTYLLKDIKPGTPGSEPFRFVVANNLLFFTTNIMGRSSELWCTDGTEAGTRRVKDINPGNAISTVFMIPLGDKLFFNADDGINGMEMWVSDGTDTGTYLFKDTDTRPNTGGDFYEPFVFKDRIYYQSKEKLWVSDGTLKGTYRLQDSMLNPVDINTPMWYSVLNGKMYFKANTPLYGEELWVSDGTDTGTRMCLDINPGTAGVKISYLKTCGDQLFFTNIWPGSGNEIWVSDGTALGTRMVKEINPGNASSNPVRFCAYEGRMYFAAIDGTNGYELWVSDGTDTGTKKLVPTFATASSPLDIFGITPFVSGNTMYFPAAYDAKGWELYKIAISRKPDAVSEPLEKAELKIFPNPFRERLFIYHEDVLTGTVILYDQLGNTVPVSLTITGNTGITELKLCGTLAPGVYCLYAGDAATGIKRARIVKY